MHFLRVWYHKLFPIPVLGGRGIFGAPFTPPNVAMGPQNCCVLIWKLLLWKLLGFRSCGLHSWLGPSPSKVVISELSSEQLFCWKYGAICFLVNDERAGQKRSHIVYVTGCYKHLQPSTAYNVGFSGVETETAKQTAGNPENKVFPFFVSLGYMFYKA